MKRKNMFKSRLLAVAIFSAFAGSFAAYAADVAVKNQAIAIKGKKNLSKDSGSSITVANGTEWSLESTTVITIDGKTVTKTELAAPAMVNCVLTGTRGGSGANVVTTLACKSA